MARARAQAQASVGSAPAGPVVEAEAEVVVIRGQRIRVSEALGRGHPSDCDGLCGDAALPPSSSSEVYFPPLSSITSLLLRILILMPSL